MHTNLSLFEADLFQKLSIHRHLKQSINERNVHMQIFKHIKKLPKFSINFGLSKALWEWRGRHARLQGSGLRVLGPLTLIMVLLTISLNSSTLRTL